jgi:hypothetical protein
MESMQKLIKVPLWPNRTQEEEFIGMSNKTPEAPSLR